MPSSEHPLALLLADAANDTFPDSDGSVEYLPEPDMVAAALVSFAGRLWVCGASPERVKGMLRPGAFSDWFGPAACAAIAAEHGVHVGNLDALLAAPGTGEGLADAAADPWLVEIEDLDHPRVARSRRYRPEARVFTTADDDGVLLVGRGLVGRWEVAFEVDPAARGRGLGRRLATAARGLVPAGEPIWAQVAPANAPSLRAVLAAGYRVVGAELLFAAEPDQ